MGPTAAFQRRSSGAGSPAPPSTPGSPASWTDGVDTPRRPHRGAHVPPFAVSMQSSLLKKISSFKTKEDLLAFVASYHCLLDLINLVTCLYRLAKLSFTQRSRTSYLADLQRSPTFQLLLRSISAQFLHAQLIFLHSHTEPKGVDSRCLANLVWALAKLDLSSEVTALSTEIALNVAPFVLRSLPNSSPQGLANTLWSYAKLPVAPPEVISALVARIASDLGHAVRITGVSSDPRPFDAQALSNSIWALAHLRARGFVLEDFAEASVALLEAVALAATRMLSRLQQQLLLMTRGGGVGGNALGGGMGAAPDASALLVAAETDFSCQALINICWALATVAGPACETHPPFVQLFAVAATEATGRLRATAALLRARRPLPYQGGHGAGQGFNEQALSNAVFAFGKAGFFTTPATGTAVSGPAHDLLSSIFDVAALRLDASAAGETPAALGAGGGNGRGSHDGAAATLWFKPQELCTLLKACHTGIAPPWGFLSALLRLLERNPSLVESWSAADKAELQRAYLLFVQHAATAQQAAAAAAAAQAQAEGEAALLARLGLMDAAAGLAAAQQMAAAVAAVQQVQQQQAQEQQQRQFVAAFAAALQQQRQEQQEMMKQAAAGALTGQQQAAAAAAAAGAHMMYGRPPLGGTGRVATPGAAGAVPGPAPGTPPPAPATAGVTLTGAVATGKGAAAAAAGAVDVAAFASAVPQPLVGRLFEAAAAPGTPVAGAR